jgi:hypothetical protein
MAARPISATTLGLTLGLWATLALSLFGCNPLSGSADHTMAEQEVARPDAIVVQEFALSPDAPDPTLAAGGKASGDDATQAAARFQASLAAHLVSAIRAMGLPAVGADAPLPPGGTVITLEGRFTSVASEDSAEQAIVELADAWPDVTVDVQIYDTSEEDDRLFEDMEFQISEANPLLVPGTPPGEPTVAPARQSAISPAVQAKLDAAAKDGADTIAKQLAPFFADQGWIAQPHS